MPHTSSSSSSLPAPPNSLARAADPPTFQLHRATPWNRLMWTLSLGGGFFLGPLRGDADRDRTPWRGRLEGLGCVGSGEEDFFAALVFSASTISTSSSRAKAGCRFLVDRGMVCVDVFICVKQGRSRFPLGSVHLPQVKLRRTNTGSEHLCLPE